MNFKYNVLNLKPRLRPLAKYLSTRISIDQEVSQRLQTYDYSVPPSHTIHIKHADTRFHTSEKIFPLNPQQFTPQSIGHLAMEQKMVQRFPHYTNTYHTNSLVITPLNKVINNKNLTPNCWPQKERHPFGSLGPQYTKYSSREKNKHWCHKYSKIKHQNSHPYSIAMFSYHPLP